MRHLSVFGTRPGFPLASMTVLAILAGGLIAIVVGWDDLAVPFLFAGVAGTFMIAGAGAILAFRGEMAKPGGPRSFRLWRPSDDHTSSRPLDAATSSEASA